MHLDQRQGGVMTTLEEARRTDWYLEMAERELRDRSAIERFGDAWTYWVKEVVFSRTAQKKT